MASVPPPLLELLELLLEELLELIDECMKLNGAGGRAEDVPATHNIK